MSFSPLAGSWEGCGLDGKFSSMGGDYNAHGVEKSLCIISDYAADNLTLRACPSVLSLVLKVSQSMQLQSGSCICLPNALSYSSH